MPAKCKIASFSSPCKGLFRVVSHKLDTLPIEKQALLLSDTGNTSEEPSSFKVCVTHRDTHIPSSTTVIQVNGCQFEDNDVVLINTDNSQVVFYYKQKSNSNALYVTDLCNSHCIMCPQPPKQVDEVDRSFIFSLVALLPLDTRNLCITGGEPTLLGADLPKLLHCVAEQCPNCWVHILTNARNLTDFTYAKQLVDSGVAHLSFGVPLYSSNPQQHDYIVQAKGAFDECTDGILNLARLGADVEIRTVIHKQTLHELIGLAEFIYRNMPFISNFALMGMENMGYVKKNWGLLGVLPDEYRSELYEAVRYLFLRGIHVSIFNIPLCLLDARIRKFSTKSISDYKQGYAEECKECSKISECGGLFARQASTYRIKPL